MKRHIELNFLKLISSLYHITILKLITSFHTTELLARKYFTGIRVSLNAIIAPTLDWFWIGVEVAQSIQYKVTIHGLDEFIMLSNKVD